VDDEVFRLRDTNLYKKKFGLNPQKKALIFVVSGPVSQFHKGFDQLKRILKEISSRDSSAPIEIVIVGFSKKGDFDEIPFNVINFENISSQEVMAELYAACDLSISCSRQDNLPSTLIEAALCGKRTISFDVGGISDVVSGDASGEVIRLGDISSFASAIQDAICRESNPQVVRNIAQSQFSPQVSAYSYLEFYNLLLNQGQTK
jgi:glycosyltransferase involved in cell wall biosynthesis